MTAAALLREAHDAGIALQAEAGQVRVSAAEAPPLELLERLRAHKAELLGLLTGTLCRRCGMRLDYQHDWSTRVFADGTGSCGDCYYLEAAERAALARRLGRRGRADRARGGAAVIPAPPTPSQSTTSWS